MVQRSVNAKNMVHGPGVQYVWVSVGDDIVNYFMARHARRERRKTINFPSSYVSWHFSLASHMPSFVSNEKHKNMTPCMQAILFWTLLPKKNLLKLSNNANLISLTKYFR